MEGNRAKNGIHMLQGMGLYLHVMVIPPSDLHTQTSEPG